MAGCFKLKKAKNGQFFFNLVAGNGQTVLASEMYKTKKAAQNGIASVQKNCGNDRCYESKTAKNGKTYFVVKARNSQVIGQSQMYASSRSCDKGIQSVKNNGSADVIKDETA